MTPTAVTETGHDYSKTLNLPPPDVKNPDGLDTNTAAIPLRANLPKREEQMLEFWRSIDVSGLAGKRSSPLGTFILHDGPPYSNGNIHLGHALNKVLKDIIVKSRSMQGYRAPYVPGWDNHGLPIETAVTQEFRQKKLQPSPTELRTRCREYATHWVNTQKAQFERLGILGAWDNPYLTMSSEFEADILATFRALVERGFIYRGLKPVHWCPTDRTALADHEVEYADRDDPSIYVAFPLAQDPSKRFDDGSAQPIEALAWTTTPWTIPANLALAVHPEHSYSVVHHGGRRYLIGKDLVAQVAAAVGWDNDYTVDAAVYAGADLEGIIFRHPLYERMSPIVLADYVSISDGTGIVHTAPGHGREDFQTGQKYGLDVLNPVDDSGRFTSDAGPEFEGLTIWEGNGAIIQALANANALAGQTTVHHSYPHCWRCHKPVIYRATRQWFMNVDHNGHRAQCLKAIGNVEWFPPESINRINAMVSNRPDWCLSRQRAWGVAIPVFYCDGCDEDILSAPAIEHVELIVRTESSDAWFNRTAAELLPDGFVCPHCGSTSFRKESDIFDVWFDSGSTNLAVLDSGRWPELKWPADVYLEGGDQHRGWFNSSLMISIAIKGSAPYRQVVTNGFALDEKGKAMSKSAGNGIAPEDVVAQHGADILRLWVGSIDYLEEVRLGKNALEQLGDLYRRLRNTLRFGLANLYDFDPVIDAMDISELEDIDRFILHRLGDVGRQMLAEYDQYEFQKATTAAHQFCTADLSAFYFDVIKDRLYSEGSNSRLRRSAQTAVYHLTTSLCLLLAPVLSFTCDEVWQKLRVPDKAASVHVARFPESFYSEPTLAEQWAVVLQFRERVFRIIESVRQNKGIGKPLEARVEASVTGDDFRILSAYADGIADILLVSEVVLEDAGSGPEAINVVRADGQKCKRCWLIRRDTDGTTGLCGRCRSVLQLAAR